MDSREELRSELSRLMKLSAGVRRAALLTGVQRLDRFDLETLMEVPGIKRKRLLFKDFNEEHDERIQVQGVG